MAALVEFAPAKVNLTLAVLGRRPDGYHLLDSLIAFADIGDWVTILQGLIFMIVVLLFRKGIVGEALAWWERRKASAT